MTINITGRKTTIKDSFREEAEREMTVLIACLMMMHRPISPYPMRAVVKRWRLPSVRAA